VERLEDEGDDLAVKGKVLELKGAGDIADVALGVREDAVVRVLDPEGLLVFGELRENRRKKRKYEEKDFNLKRKMRERTKKGGQTGAKTPVSFSSERKKERKEKKRKKKKKKKN